MTWTKQRYLIIIVNDSDTQTKHFLKYFFFFSYLSFSELTDSVKKFEGICDDMQEHGGIWGR